MLFYYLNIVFYPSFFLIYSTMTFLFPIPLIHTSVLPFSLASFLLFSFLVFHVPLLPPSFLCFFLLTFICSLSFSLVSILYTFVLLPPSIVPFLLPYVFPFLWLPFSVLPSLESLVWKSTRPSGCLIKQTALDFLAVFSMKISHKNSFKKNSH